MRAVRNTDWTKVFYPNSICIIIKNPPTIKIINGCFNIKIKAINYAFIIKNH